MRLRLLVSEAWRSLAANVSTTFAATMTVLVGMFLLGLFIAFGTYVVSWSNHVKHELVVKVDFKTKPQATRAQEEAVINRLQTNPDVRPGGIKFISKEQALLQMKKRYPTLTRSLPYNPLPDSLEVTPLKAEYNSKVAASLWPLPPGVQHVDDGKKVSSRILQVAHWIDGIFIVATAVLLIASTLLIANTIRLSIFSRRREIEVMKLVGATNWFVRGPFMVEGLLCGLGGALLAVFFLVLGKEIALPAILHDALSSDPTVHALSFPLNALILLGMGLALGAVGSGLTLRRFLQV
ncbi:MAG: ABC transporter permease [Actinobacteria bacterium]|nr:ABC transporter permease [Actinomycetota bacterium]MBV8397024.1 ABC transporter permease [Actinomycetota bacterium]